MTRSSFTLGETANSLHPSNNDPTMQSHFNIIDEDGLVLPGDNHDRLSNTYVVRKIVDADNAGEYRYFCFEDWQIGDGMVRLRCCNHWLQKDCLFKSVLDGPCPTCGIWVASLDDAQVPAGAREKPQIQYLRRPCE